MNANELADALDWVCENHLTGIGDADFKATATMLRQQQAEIEELEKENNDLRYLIATKLEQQDGISLNSMAHPVTNTPEPSYEIDPDKLETIEIDLPSPEPVAWGMLDKDGGIYDSISPEEHDREEGAYTIPLYTHPTKTLTDEQIFKLAEMLEIKMNHALYAFARTLITNAQENLDCYEKLSDASKMVSKPISEKSRAILRKAQE